MADIQSNINVNIDTSNALASIKLLQSQISAFQRDMAKTDLYQSGQSQQKLIDSINATGKFNASLKSIKSTTESFTTALEKNKLSLGQYFKYSMATTKTFGNMFKTEMGVVEKVARERVKSLQTQYINLGRDANGALKAISIRPLMLDLDNLQTKTAIAAQKQQLLNQLLQQGSTNLLNFGKNTQWAGRQLMVGFTIPLAMAGTAAAKAYMDIEKAAVQIKRVYGDMNTSVQETNKMVDSIRNLAGEYTQYGIAVADTMAMAAKAAAMGKTGSELLAQVSSASKLAALGGVDQNTALETTISLTNAFGLASTDLAGKINFLNAVENQTVLSIEDMTTAIPKAAPVVKQLGGGIEDLTFFMTAMKEGGINASEGANAIKSGLSALINPTKKASDFLAGFGVNVTGIVEKDKGNLRKTVVDFATALNTIDPLNRARAIEMMFGKFQFARISTLLKNVTDSGSQASKALALANTSSIQLAALSRRELEKVASSPMYKFQKAVTDLNTKLAPIGETFLKAVTPIIGFVSKALAGFNGMSDQFKNFAVIGVAVLGGLAPVLLMVVGLFANGAANIIKFVARIGSFLNKTKAGTRDLGSSTSYLTEEQIKAEAVAASLDQIHGKLKQTFTSEAAAVDMLTAAYERSILAQSSMGMGPVAGKAAAKGFATGGIVSGPGTSTSDSVPANLSNGEVVLSVETVKRNPALIGALLSGKKVMVPGYAKNGVAGASMSDLKKQAGLYKAPTVINQQTSAMTWDTFEAEKAAVEAAVKGLLGDTEQTVKKIANLTQKQASHIVPDTVSTDVEGKQVEVKRWKGKNLQNDTGYVNNFLNAASMSTKFLDDFEKTDLPAIAKKLGMSIEDTTKELDNVRKGLHPTTKKSAEFVKELGGVAEKKGPENLRYQGAAAKAGLGVRLKGNYYDTLSDRAYDSKQDDKAAKQVATRTARLGKLLSGNKDETTPKPAKQTVVAKPSQSQNLESRMSKIRESRVSGIKINSPEPVSQNRLLGPDGATQVSKYSIPKESRQSNRLPGALPGRMPSPFLQNLKASVAAAPGNIANEGRMLTNEAKNIFAQFKNIFRIGGKEAITEAKTGIIQETPRLRVAGKEAGFDYVTALKGGNGSIAAVVTAGNQKLVAAALKEYNSGGSKVAGSIYRGLDKGIAAYLAKGMVAGERLANSVTEGVDKVRKKKQKKLPAKAEGPLEEGGQRGNVAQRAANKVASGASAAKGKLAEGYNKLNSKINISSDGSGAFAKVGAAATTAAFALSGMPGPIGETVSKILPFMGIMTALSGVMSMFNIEVVAGTISMGALSVPILPLVAGLVLLGGIIFALVGWQNKINAEKAKELKNINATSKAAESAAAALDGIGKVTGVDTTQSGFVQSEGAVQGMKTGQVNDVNTLLNSQEFQHGKTAGFIRDFKAVGGERDRKESLMGIARNMQASGADQKTINDTLTAIQTKAYAGTDKKMITIDPKSYTQGAAANNAAVANTGVAAAGKINKLGGQFNKVYGLDIEKQIRISDINAKIGKGPGKITQAEAKKQIDAIKGEIKEFAKYNNQVKAYGVNTAMSMSAAGKAFLTGKTSLKQFHQQQAAVTRGFNQLDAAGKQDSLAAMRESIAKSSPATAAMAATIKDAGLQLLFLQEAAAGGGGAFTADLIAGANSGSAAGVKAFNDAAKNYDKTAQSKYKKEHPKDTSGDQSGAGGTNPKDVLTGLQDAVKLSQVTQQLMTGNYSADFIANITGADEATMKYYTTIKNGKRVLNEQGKALYAAYNAKTIADFLVAQKGIVAGATLELKARSQLKAAGLSAEDVKTMAARSDVQAALAAANATVGAKKRAAAVKAVTDALKAEVEATKSLKTAQEIFQESYDKGTAYLDNQEAKINNDFDRSATNLNNKATILKANQAIEDLQNGVGGKTGLNQYSDGLSKLQFREDEINKKYDERAKALNKVATINQRISEQTKGQLSLAQALSSGDIAAAAQAAQDMNAANATAAIEDQKTNLDLARQNELDAATVMVNGKLMTRKEIEDASKVIQEQILDIQIQQLNPAQAALTLAERARDASLNAISNQKLEWESWKIAVDGATTSLEAYNAAVAAANPSPVVKTIATPVYNSQGFTTSGNASVYGSFMNTVGYNNAQAPVSRSMGGIVPGYFAAGGYAKGTDTVPAMLTPGEFVVRKFAVDSFGVDKLNAINNGTMGSGTGNILTAVTNNSGMSSSSSAYTDASVYNYNVSVNVKTDSNPDQIAQAVMTRINQASGQQIRGNRFNG